MILSMIIATRNRETVLLESLCHVLTIIEKYDWVELIIVNDGDTTLVQHFKNPRIKYLENTIKGVSNARNIGAKCALGNYLFFMDDDIWPTTHFIDWFASVFQEQDFDKSVYNINWHYPESLLSKLHKFKVGRYLIKYNYNTMWGRMGHLYHEPTNGKVLATGIGSGSFLIKRSIFEALGGYQQSIRFQGEDIEFSNRLHKANIPIYAIFDTLVYHNHTDRIRLKEYLQREYQGYHSEYQYRANAHLAMNSSSGFKNLFFEFLSPWEQMIIWILQYIPNIRVLDMFSLKMVGLLSALQKHKAMKIWAQQK